MPSLSAQLYADLAHLDPALAAQWGLGLAKLRAFVCRDLERSIARAGCAAYFATMCSILAHANGFTTDPAERAAAFGFTLLWASGVARLFDRE